LFGEIVNIAVKLGHVLCNRYAFSIDQGPLPIRSRAFSAPAPCVDK
jgi:hypothetical protein